MFKDILVSGRWDYKAHPTAVPEFIVIPGNKLDTAATEGDASHGGIKDASTGGRVDITVSHRR